MVAHYAWIIPLIPLGAFVLLLAFGRAYRTAGVMIGTAASLVSFLLSLLVFAEKLIYHAADYREGVKWISIGNVQLNLGFEVTNLSALMLVMVTAVTFLVHWYAAAYMKDDERATVFYSYLSLLGFSMLGLVLADNLFGLYIFWELLGVGSFLLIGFWYQRPAVREAAKKAFIVTRIGDVCLLLAVVLLFVHMPNHALDFVSLQNVLEQTGLLSAGMITLVALLIFAGAAGKAAQFPLHLWLPDTAEAPSPAGALIHTVTMLAAGVYLIIRTFDLFEASQTAMMIMGCIGGFTAVLAAAIATVQNDLKPILSYSAMSQLGYAMLALGLGSITGAVFQLLANAFITALLFLGAGNVIRAASTRNIQEMGGLAPSMRMTSWTFAIGALALSGIPPLSGFWSKDAILHTALQDHHPVLFALGTGASFLTAFCMARVYFIVFTGKAAARQRITGPSGALTLPLTVLSVFTALLGFTETPWNNTLGKWLSDDGTAIHTGGGLVMVISAAAGILGIYLGWLVFYKGMIARDAISSRMPWLSRTLEQGFCFGGLFRLLFADGLRLLGKLLRGIEFYVLGGLEYLLSRTVMLIGKGGNQLQGGRLQISGLLTLLVLLVIIIAVAGRRFW